MNNLFILFEAFLKVSAEMLSTLAVAFVCIVVKEIYQSLKNRKRVTYGN